MPSAEECIRLRLTFTNPPPEMPSSSKYMILIKPSTCSTVHDLEQLIIRKFGFPKGVTMSLSLEGFTLLSTEEIMILRNNDNVCVSVLYDVKAKKIKLCSKDDTTKSKIAKIGIKCTEKHGKKKYANNEESKTNKAARKRNIKQKVYSTGGESSSDCESSSKRVKTTIADGNHKSETKIESKKNLPNMNGAATLTLEKKEKTVKISSSDNSNSSVSGTDSSNHSKEKAQCTQIKETFNTDNGIERDNKSLKSNGLLPTPLQRCRIAKIIGKGHVTFSSSSDSDMETELQDKEEKSLKSWLNSSKVKLGEGSVQDDSIFLNESRDPGVSTNVSVIFQNPTPTPNKMEMPVRDYSKLLPSTWPPRIGDVIAYKLLEMSEDYTPVISQYKEVKILEIYTPDISPIGVSSVKAEFLWPKLQKSKKKTGRFEMDLSEDESNDIINNEQVLEWQTMLEPLLVL